MPGNGGQFQGISLKIFAPAFLLQRAGRHTSKKDMVAPGISGTLNGSPKHSQNRFALAVKIRFLEGCELFGLMLKVCITSCS